MAAKKKDEAEKAKCDTQKTTKKNRREKPQKILPVCPPRNVST